MLGLFWVGMPGIHALLNFGAADHALTRIQDWQQVGEDHLFILQGARENTELERDLQEQSSMRCRVNQHPWVNKPHNWVSSG